MYPRAVCLLYYNHETKKILSVSRPGQPNLDGLPGGKVEPNEGLHQAVARELREETGLVATWPDPVYRAICPGEVTYETTVFWCRNVLGQVKAEEGLFVAFMPPEVLMAGPFGEFNRRLFQVTGIIPMDDGSYALGFANRPEEFEWDGWR